MVYRLVHVQPTRRQAFKDNRWAAQPARLVELVLKRGCTPESRRSRRGCRLRVDLDEFYQRFDSSQASRGSIEARVALLAPRADQPLAVQAFTLDHVAPTPDAAGGVLALRAATLQLDRDIRDWLRGLDGRVGAGVRARCGA
jgi:cholesterol transport system auxiliary component